MKKAALTLLIVIVISALFLAFTLTSGSSEKMAYVNTTELYNGFTLKKELEAKLTKTQMARKNILDSLMIQLQVLSGNMEKNKEDRNHFEFFRQQYLQKKKEFDEDNTALANQYTSQVWEQLNQYVKDYGKQNHYKFIFGATGEGNIMYAEEADNLSNEIITYANQRYEGKTTK